MTGSEVISALEKSSSRLSEIAFSPLASPTSSTAGRGALVGARTGSSAAPTLLVRFDLVGFGDPEFDQPERPFGGDLSPGALVVGALEVADERQLAEPRFDIVRPPRLAVRAVDRLPCPWLWTMTCSDRDCGEAAFERPFGRRRFPIACFAVVERLRPQRAADHDRRDHKGDPPPDRGLPMTGAPTPRPSRQPQLPPASHHILRPEFEFKERPNRRSSTLRESRCASNEASRRKRPEACRHVGGGVNPTWGGAPGRKGRGLFKLAPGTRDARRLGERAVSVTALAGCDRARDGRV